MTICQGPTVRGPVEMCVVKQEPANFVDDDFSSDESTVGPGDSLPLGKW